MLDVLRPHVDALVLALGPDDLNDHGELRHDPSLQTAASRMETLASPSTLCRLEQRADRETAVALHQALFDPFVGAHATVPRRLVLDVDATDTSVARRAGRPVLSRGYLLPRLLLFAVVRVLHPTPAGELFALAIDRAYEDYETQKETGRNIGIEPVVPPEHHRKEPWCYGTHKKQETQRGGISVLSIEGTSTNLHKIRQVACRLRSSSRWHSLPRYLNSGGNP